MNTKYWLFGLIITLIMGCSPQMNNGKINNQKIGSTMSTIEKNKQVVRQFYEEGWNNRNFEIVQKTHSEKWIHHDHSNPNDIGGGPEGNIKRMKDLVQAFPDLKFSIDEMVAEGDKVVVRFIASGTHKGQFGPIPATNRSVRMSGYITHRIENSEIIEDWVVRDTYGLLMQLGVINAGK